MNPSLSNAPRRVWTRLVLIATIGSLLASMLTMIASLVAIPQASAQTSTNSSTSTNPSIAKVEACEQGGATVVLYVDNKGNPMRRFNMTVDWKTLPGTAPENSSFRMKAYGVHDGVFEVSYTFGYEKIKATLDVKCKKELGMPTTDISTGCVGVAGYATFQLNNPTNRSVTFDLGVYGKDVQGSDNLTEQVTVPARQDRTVNFMNLPDANYLFDVGSSAEPMDSYFRPLRASNIRSSIRLECSAQNPSRRPAERKHIVSTSCEGTRAVANLHTGGDVKRITVEMGSYKVNNFVPVTYRRQSMIRSINSGVYDIYVRVGSTLETFKNMPVDCDNGTYVDKQTGTARAEIKTSCLRENGRIDAYVYNETQSSKTFYLDLAPLAPRSITVRAGGENRMTITGRSDDNYTAVVRDDSGKELAKSNFTVACDPPPVPARVKTSCLAGNGRVDVLVGNTTNRTQSYEVRVGTISREATVTAGKHKRVTVTGRKDGRLGITVKQGGRQIHSEVVRISCD